jgi:uncharacterized damage-inducible protein DinB
MEFTRVRVIGTLDTIAKSGQNPSKVLAWRPGSGRAHIAWQAMHMAATHDRYINERLCQKPVSDPELNQRFGGGSTPSDQNVPDLETIRRTLEKHYTHARDYFRALAPSEIERAIVFPNNVKRTIGESCVLLTFHEAHHQGQMHLTWNLYKAAHGVA